MRMSYYNRRIYNERLRYGNIVLPHKGKKDIIRTFMKEVLPHNG